MRLRPARRRGHGRLRAALPPTGPRVTVVAEFTRAGQPFAVAVPFGQPGLTKTMHLLTLNDDGRPVQVARVEHGSPAEPKFILSARLAALASLGRTLENSGASTTALALWHALVDGTPIDPQLQLRIAPHPLITARFAAYGWDLDFREPRWFRN